MTKFPTLLLVLFLGDFIDLAAGDFGGSSHTSCILGSDKCPSDEGCYKELICVNCKLAAEAGEYPKGCIPWPILIACSIIGIIFWCVIAFVICWFVAACPLYKWKMSRKNRQGARGYGGGQRSQSPRNVSKSASKTSQKPRSKPASASASKASQKK